MAAGLGFKTFTTGEVLTAADTNGYLMQGVLVFADAAARTAAITSPQEGQVSYLKDTNSTEYYSGSAWVAVGAAGGGLTLISTTALTSTNVVLSSIPQTYKDLKLIIRDYLPSTDGQLMDMRFNADTGTRYNRQTYGNMDNTSQGFGLNRLPVCPSNDNAVANGLSITTIYDYANTDTYKLCENFAVGTNSATTTDGQYQGGFLTFNQTGAISSITLFVTAGTFAGTALLYGVS